VKTKRIRSFWVILASGLGIYALLAAAGCIHHADKEDEELFIVQHVRYSIKPGQLEAYLPLLAELEAATRQVPGVLSFQHYHDRQDENIIFLEGRFKTKEIAQQVFDSPARAKYLAAAADMWAGMTQFSWYTVTKERDILAEM
jgi:quinol monooxygenase YgiN